MSTPKKSKAFIITFVLILLLLLLGYWLFTNKDKVFKTGGLNLGRIFEPLVESPDRKPLQVIWDSIFNPGDIKREENPDAFTFDPNNNIYNLPVVNISASPSSIKEGESSIISWTSNNSVSCKTPNGTQTGTSGSFSTGPLNSSKSFSVSCTGKNGTVSNNITIRVGERDIDPFLFPIVSGNAQPSPIQPGESSTVSWDSNNTTSCDSGAGNPTATRGSFVTGPLYATTAYSIICTGEDGTSGRNIFVIVRDSLDYEFDKCPINEADNPPLCTTKNGECIEGETNPPLCTVKNNVCVNGATNPDACDVFEHPFCAANKITTELSTTNKNDKEQVTFLQTILSKLPSSSGTTYLKDTDIDGDYGNKTKTAVALFQKDNGLQETGEVNIETMNAINNKCNEFFNNNGLSQCSDGIDNDGKEGVDNEDSSCHTDFNANNPASYDKFIRDESRVKTNAECGDGLNNDNEEGPDYQDKDCHTDGNVNNWDSYYKDIASEKGGLPTPDNVCGNKAINYPDCDIFENVFCAANKITEELSTTNKSNKEQVTFLQTILSKLPSSSGTTYLKDTDIDGDYGNKTKTAVTLFQKDNGLQETGEVNIETMNAINNKCNEFFSNTTKCSNPNAANPSDCNKDDDGKCLNGSTNADCKLDPFEKNKCAIFDQYPLDFTDEEKAELAELLRKFYLLAPSLKTEEDLNLLYNEIEKYTRLIKQANELTKQCYLETNNQIGYNDFILRNPSYKKTNDTLSYGYTGPKTILGNPWFKPVNIGTYIDEKNARELYPLGIENTDTNYTLKLKAGDGDTYTPLVTKKPTADEGRSYNKRGSLWDWNDSFDVNGVMLDRIREFELLLYIW